MYFLNPPPIFAKMLFPLATSLLNQKMRSRLHVLPTPRIHELAVAIDHHNLPAEYGGAAPSQHAAWIASLERCLAPESASLWPVAPVVPQRASAAVPDGAAVAAMEPAARGRWELFTRYDGDQDGRLDRTQLQHLLVHDVFAGEMDESWFEDIWQQAASVEPAGGAPALIDYDAFVKLF